MPLRMRTTSIWLWSTAPASAPIIQPARSKNDPRRCPGRSGGGSGTKIHALTNQDGLPIRYELTPGQAHDAPPCKPLPGALQPGQYVLADKACDAAWIREMIWEQGATDVIPSGSNRKLPKAQTLIGDRGYDSNKIRKMLAEQKIEPCIPPKKNRKETIEYCKTTYKTRHRVENLFARLKDWRRIATRYDRCAHTFRSAIYIAATIIFWL